MPKGSWLLGHLEFLGRFDHHQIMTRWAAELGGIYRMRMAWTHVRAPTASRMSIAERVLGSTTMRKVLPASSQFVSAEVILGVQAVVITDPVLVAAALDKANEVEKNSKAVYSKFNVVSFGSLALTESASLLDIARLSLALPAAGS